MADRPNCYECTYRRQLAGNAHSKCAHPTAEEVKKAMGPIAGLLEFFPGPASLDVGMVEGDPHGIRMGWFTWPFNFDPTWLVRCDGFTKKEEVTQTK